MIDILNRELNRAIQLPDVRERLAALGTEAFGGAPERLAGSIRVAAGGLKVIF